MYMYTSCVLCVNSHGGVSKTHVVFLCTQKEGAGGRREGGGGLGREVTRTGEIACIYLYNVHNLLTAIDAYQHQKMVRGPFLDVDK